MARRAARASWALVAVLALAFVAQEASAAWGSSKKAAAPAGTAVATPAPAPASAQTSHVDVTSVNTYWRAPRAAARRSARRAHPKRGCEGAGPLPLRSARALTRVRRRYNEVSGEVSATDPLANFHGFPSPSGHPYWVDPDTGVATWTRPAPYAWKEEPSAEHPGHTYFYNTVRAPTARGAGRARAPERAPCTQHISNARLDGNMAPSG